MTVMRQSTSWVRLSMVTLMIAVLAWLGIRFAQHSSDIGKYLVQWTTYLLLGLPFFWLIKKKLNRLYSADKNQIIIGLGLVAVASIYSLLSHPSHEQFVIFALSSLLVGFVEELIFRGYFFTVTENSGTSEAKTIIGTSMLFALWHIPNILLISHNWVMLVTTFAFGCTFGIVRQKSKNLLLVSLVHAAVDISS